MSKVGGYFSFQKIEENKQIWKGKDPLFQKLKLGTTCSYFQSLSHYNVCYQSVASIIPLATIRKESFSVIEDGNSQNGIT